MNHNGATRTTDPAPTASFSSLARDVVELGELQTQLLMLDLQQTSGRLRRTAVVAVVGFAVLLGCFPVGLLAIAEMLVQSLGWSRASALAVSSLAGLTLSVMLLVRTWLWLGEGLTTFNRSLEELRRNVSWLKSALKDDSASFERYPIKGRPIP